MTPPVEPAVRRDWPEGVKPIPPPPDVGGEEAERARKRIRDGVIDALKRNHDNRKGKRRGRR